MLLTHYITEQAVGVLVALTLSSGGATSELVSVPMVPPTNTHTVTGARIENDPCNNYLAEETAEHLELVWSFELGEDACMTASEQEANLALGEELLAEADTHEELLAEEQRISVEESLRPGIELVHEFGRTFTLEQWDSLMADYDLAECEHEDTIPTSEPCLWFGGTHNFENSMLYTAYPDGSIVIHWQP